MNHLLYDSVWPTSKTGWKFYIRSVNQTIILKYSYPVLQMVSSTFYTKSSRNSYFA